MQERLRSVGVIAPKSMMEVVSKFFLDSGSFEVIPIESVFDVKLGKIEGNPYAEFLKLAHSLYEEVGKKPKPKVEKVSLPTVFDEDEFERFTSDLKKEMDEIDEKIEELKEEVGKLEEEIVAVRALRGFDGLISRICEMKLAKVVVGKIHEGYLSRLFSSLRDLEVVVEKVGRDGENAVCSVVYPSSIEGKVEEILRSVSFRKLEIPCLDEDAEEALFELLDRRKALLVEIEEMRLKKRKLFYENRRKIYSYYDTVYVLKNVYDFLESAGTTEEFFAVLGWTTEKSLEDLRKLSEELGVVLLFEDVEVPVEKPTKLKNPEFFKHFEFLVKMYGIPRSDEIDPTPLISILFLFFYGFMFGDIGHGLTISILSYLLYRKSKSDLWYVMGFAGISSAVFGILYGSIFGFEVIPALLARPMENINAFLATSVYIGATLITLGMILNVVNRLRRRETKEVIFDPNGIAGIGLYLLTFYSAAYYVSKGELPFPAGVFLSVFSLFVVLIFLYFVLFEEGKIGERLTLAFFETFDRLLMFFSNTLSFIRLGAFAMNHAGLFLAFYIMAQMSKSGFGAFLSLLLGNLLLIFLEGLVVFIQAVRLEFYEFFSKFYSGDGREFNPVRYKDTEGGV